jgi:HK97 family phage prohead protease
MDTEKEVRAYEVDTIELRKKGESETDSIRWADGVAIVYDKETEIFDGYFEKIGRNAFTKWLEGNPKIRCLFNHNYDFVLSDNQDSNPPLEIKNMGDGLFFSTPINENVSYGKDLLENLRHKNIGGCSFAFSVDKEDIKTRADGTQIRTVLEGKLYEISIVVSPAYLQTSVCLRSMEKLKSKDVFDKELFDKREKDIKLLELI